MEHSGPIRYVLLDRDGVINEAIRGDYVAAPEQVRLVPGAGEAVSRLNGAGFGVLVISNQQGVGKGLYSRAELEHVSAHLHHGFLLLHPFGRGGVPVPKT